MTIYVRVLTDVEMHRISQPVQFRPCLHFVIINTYRDLQVREFVVTLLRLDGLVEWIYPSFNRCIDRHPEREIIEPEIKTTAYR